MARGRAGEKPTLLSIKADDGDDTARAGVRLFMTMRQQLEHGKPDGIYVERMFEHSFKAEVDFDARTIKQRQGVIAAFDMARMIHTVDLFAGLLSIPIIKVAPSTARKEFIGRGDLDRKAAKRRVLAMCSLLGWEAENDNEGDAGCIWHYGVAISSPRLAARIHGGLHAKAATIAAGVVDAVKPVDDRVPW